MNGILPLYKPVGMTSADAVYHGRMRAVREGLRLGRQRLTVQGWRCHGCRLLAGLRKCLYRRNYTRLCDNNRRS